MEIKKENIISAYNSADENGKRMLIALFGEEAVKQADNRPVTERIKTFEDACRELGLDSDSLSQKWADAGLDMPDEVAYQKLRIITAALNEGWQPKFTEDEERYYPWFWLYTEDELIDKSDNWKQERALMSTGDYETEFAGFAFAHSSDAPSSTYTFVMPLAFALRTATSQRIAARSLFGCGLTIC